MATVRDLAMKKTRGILTKTEKGRSKAEMLVMIQKEGSIMFSQIIIIIAIMIANVIMIAIVVAIRESKKEERMKKIFQKRKTQTSQYISDIHD
eukprot:4732410-Ditylum_brightwellii.AAC.1